MAWEFSDRDCVDKEHHTHFFYRQRLEDEFYINRILAGVEEIITRNGGVLIFEYPIPEMQFRQGEEGEVSILYCHGITLKNGYQCGRNRRGEKVDKQIFWTKVYTSREDWKDAPVIRDLEEFFKIEDLTQVSDLKRLLWPESHRPLEQTASR